MDSSDNELGRSALRGRTGARDLELTGLLGGQALAVGELKDRQAQALVSFQGTLLAPPFPPGKENQIPGMT